MNKDKFKNKTYKNFFISHIALLIIPVLIITLIISKSVFNILEKEIEMRDSTALTYSTYILNDNLSNCRKISENISISDDIKSFEFGTDVAESMRIISTLNKYVATNSFFDDIFISFFDDNYIYSSTSSYTFERFIDTFSSNDNFTLKLSDTLKNIKSPTLLRDTSENKLYFALPYISNNSNVGSIIFSINMKTLNSIINSSNSSRIPILIDNNKNIINLSTEDIGEYEKDILKFVDNNENDLSDNSFSRIVNDYSVFLSKLPSNDLYLLSITTSDSLFYQISHLTKLLIMTILLTFIFGSIAVLIFIKKHYEPINHLKEVSKKLYIENHNQSNYNEFNEFDLIENTIHALQDKNSELEEEFSKNIPMIKNYKLNELINGTLSDKNTFLKEAKDIGLSFSSKYHGIVLVKSKDSLKFKVTSLKELLTEFNIQNFSIEYEIPIHTFINETDIFLIGLNQASITLNNSKLILNEDITIAIGSIFDDISLLAKSYVDARRNLEVSSNKVNNQSFKDFISKYDIHLKNINELVSKGELNEAYFNISSILNELNKEALPFKLVRSIYFEIIIMYNNFIDKNKNIPKSKNIDLSTLYEINSLDELNDVFKEISTELIELTKLKKDIDSPKLSVDKIKEFILSNYTDYSFSLQLVSDNFNISLSYLSQYFKDKTGITILEYITELKINRAKDLLLNSNAPLKDIAEELGYSNVSSFIRRFKQVTSMTPGEFKRNKFKEDKQ